MPTYKQEMILGIDPGFAITGYGLVKHVKNDFKTIKYGAITSTPKEPHHLRLAKINRGLNKIIKKYKPSLIAVEKIYFSKNTKTALKVGEARGVILLTASLAKLPIREFTPLEIKQALTGYGLASKKQIQKMVAKILSLKKIPQPDDVADALAIAICCGQTKIF